MLGPRSNNTWRNRYIALGLFGLLCWFLLNTRATDSVPYRAWKTTSGLAKYSQTTGKSIQATRLGQHPFREPLEDFEKPLDFRIVALIFYGRKEYVQILECYLQASYALHLVATWSVKTDKSFSATSQGMVACLMKSSSSCERTLRTT